MTMADVKRLFAHWTRYPPLRDLVAAAIGFEIPTQEAEEPARYMTADEFKRMLAFGGGRIDGVPGVGGI